MRFRLLTLLLAFTAVCTGLGLAANAEKIPAGALTMAMAPLGIAMAVLIAVWRNTEIPTKVVLAVLFAVGWCYLMVYVEVVLALFRSLRHADADLEAPFFAAIIGLFAAPAILLCMLLLRSWLWAWHDRFDHY